MSTQFTQGFKVQAVEKALCRAHGVSLKEIALNVGVGLSSLNKWIRLSKSNELERTSRGDSLSNSDIKQERRPQDWPAEERLNIVIACHDLDESALSEHCRAKGVYPHHIARWRKELIERVAPEKGGVCLVEIRKIRSENKALKKELCRKDKALAETAALLVLQKKVREIWGSDEGNLP